MSPHFPRELASPLWNALVHDRPTDVALLVKYPPNNAAAARALWALVEELPAGFPGVPSPSDAAGALLKLIEARHSVRRGFYGTSITFAWACVRFATLGAEDFNPQGKSGLGAWLVRADTTALLHVLSEAAQLAEKNPLPPPSGPPPWSPPPRQEGLSRERERAAHALRTLAERHVPEDFAAMKDRSARLKLLLRYFERHCGAPHSWFLAFDALNQAVFGVQRTSHPADVTDWLWRVSREELVSALHAAACWVPFLPWLEVSHDEA